MIAADGSSVQRLTDGSADDRDPTWSPDGTEIAFASDRDGESEIYMMGADGSNVRRLTDNDIPDEIPVWRPDRTRVVVAAATSAAVPTPALPTATPTTPAPTATPTPEAQPLIVVKQWFARTRPDRLSYAFVVENPNQDLALEDTRYHIVAYDEAGIVLGTRSSSIAVVFPNERLGVADTLLALEGAKVARLEVQLRPEETTVSELTGNPFTAEQVEYVPDEYFPQVTGLVKSSWGEDTRITFTAIAYDESGVIIGGGFAHGMAEANGQGVVSVIVDVAGQQPAKVELYPAFLSHTDLLR